MWGDEPQLQAFRERLKLLLEAQQQEPLRISHPAPVAAIGNGLEVADQIEIGCGRSAVGHKEEAIPPTSTHADNPGKEPWDRL